MNGAVFFFFISSHCTLLLVEGGNFERWRVVHVVVLASVVVHVVEGGRAPATRVVTGERDAWSLERRRCDDATTTTRRTTGLDGRYRTGYAERARAHTETPRRFGERLFASRRARRARDGRRRFELILI